jgi:hypothetical protein
MNGFVKIDCNILYSSIWAESSETRIIWITMLAMANQNGIVPATAPGISSAAFVSLSETRKAINILESPDPDSKSLENEGRRIERVEGGYLILNYDKYRAFNYSMKDEAIYMREYREKKKKESELKDDKSYNVITKLLHSASASASESGIDNKIERLRKESEVLQRKFKDAWMENIVFYKSKYQYIVLEFQFENIIDWVKREPSKAKRSAKGDLNLFFQRWLNKEKPQMKQKGYPAHIVTNEEIMAAQGQRAAERLRELPQLIENQKYLLEQYEAAMAGAGLDEQSIKIMKGIPGKIKELEREMGEE